MRPQPQRAPRRHYAARTACCSLILLRSLPDQSSFVCPLSSNRHPIISVSTLITTLPSNHTFSLAQSSLVPTLRSNHSLFLRISCFVLTILVVLTFNPTNPILSFGPKSLPSPFLPYHIVFLLPRYPISLGPPSHIVAHATNVWGDGKGRGGPKIFESPYALSSSSLPLHCSSRCLSSSFFGPQLRLIFTRLSLFPLSLHHSVIILTPLLTQPLGVLFSAVTLFIGGFSGCPPRLHPSTSPLLLPSSPHLSLSLRI